MKAESIYKLLDAIIKAQKQIIERNSKILEDITEAEKQIKENNNEPKATI